MTAFTHVRRIIVSLSWTLLAGAGWIGLLYGGLRLYVYGRQHYGWPPLSDWMEWVLLWGMFGFGTIMVTVAVLLLGIGGRLPGTRERSRVQAGFPVERVAPPLSTRAPGPES